MIVYHGTPFGGERIGVAKFLANRDALIPFARQEDLPVALDVCRTVIADNSAFTAWRSGKAITDWQPYYEWVRSLKGHPRFAWAIIPDVIDGSEAENDELWGDWPIDLPGVPVWHLHESIERLERMVRCNQSHICLGSSGEYANPGTERWHDRMAEAMRVLCDDSGKPRARFHGLRMACPRIVERYPFSSVDSTNVSQNANSIKRFGMYPAPTRWQRAETLAARMEAVKSPGVFNSQTRQEEFQLEAMAEGSSCQ